MEFFELGIIILDLTGLFLISWYLFAVPEPLKFTYSSPYGMIMDLKPVENAINKITRNFNLIYKMRFGFFILVFSQILKVGLWKYKF